MLKILLVLLLIALVVYGVTRAIERRGISPAPTRRPAPRQVAPDDDPDFLWDIERRRRHQSKGPRPDEIGPDEIRPDEPASDQDIESDDSDSSGTT